MKTYEEVENEVKKRLSKERFYHSKCVSQRCVELAQIYGENIEEARLVGIAHDIAKEMPHEEKIKYCKDHELDIDSVEFKSPGLLHSKVGAEIAREEFGFNDKMCEAIANHTTGKEGMDTLSKIVYISDFTSDDRPFEDKDYFLNLARENIDQALLESYTKAIMIRIEEGKTIHLSTVKARNEYLKK